MYDRDAIIASTDLPALADELLGARRGTARTPAWPCPNPQHAQTGRTPPVSVFTSHRGEQRWRCHGCGAGGTAIDLVMVCGRTDLRDALERLARRVGHQPSPEAWTPSKREPAMTQRPLVRGCADQEGMDRYVDSCAAVLFSSDGQSIRRWLTETRGLPEDVLRVNKIGADLGPRRQQRPHGMARAVGAMLPVIVEGHAVYAQVRVVHQRPDGPRYLNPTSALASNPRLAYFRPAEHRHREVIVTEGAIDALSAAAAGFRSAAVLSAAYADQAVAHELSRLPEPLVIAFDQDDAGRAAAHRLTALLEAQQRRPANLAIPATDLNAALVSSANWPSEFEVQVNASVAQLRAGMGRGIG